MESTTQRKQTKHCNQKRIPQVVTKITHTHPQLATEESFVLAVIERLRQRCDGYRSASSTHIGNGSTRRQRE